MAIIEIVFPQLIKDAKVIEEAVQKVLPTFLPKLCNGGVLGGLRGFIRLEDQQDVTSSFREILVLEWPSASSFYNFIESPGFAEFKVDLKPYATGPPELKLFETNTGVDELLQHQVLEILLIRPRDATKLGAIASLLEEVEAGVKQTHGAYMIHGASLNVAAREIVVFGAYHDELHFENKERQEFLSSIRQVSEVTQLVADVNRIPF